MSLPAFPAPWHIERIAGGFRITDAVGRSLCNVYGYERTVATNAHALEIEDAHKLAVGITMLPGLIEMAMAVRHGRPR